MQEEELFIDFFINDILHFLGNFKEGTKLSYGTSSHQDLINFIREGMPIERHYYTGEYTESVVNSFQEALGRALNLVRFNEETMDYENDYFFFFISE